MIKRIIIYILIFGLGVFFGWWLNELYRFGDAMRNDIYRPFNPDSLVFNIDSIKHKEKTKDDVIIMEKTSNVELIESMDSSIQKEQVDIKKDNRINLDEILKDSYNTYLASFENGDLSLCSYQLFDLTEKVKYSAFIKTTEKYNPFEKAETVIVYRKDSSFVKTYFNDYVTPNRTVILCGRILSNDLLRPSKVQIGMKKSDFLNLFFQTGKIYNQIESVSIYEDEMGEIFTSYIFSEDSLAEIKFDSDCDWVDKK